MMIKSSTLSKKRREKKENFSFSFLLFLSLSFPYFFLSVCCTNDEDDRPLSFFSIRSKEEVPEKKERKKGEKMKRESKSVNTCIE